jgi:hypothetical protein
VILRSSSAKSLSKIFCIERIYEQETLKVRGRFFKSTVPTFNTPYISSDIGNYYCTGGLEGETTCVDFTAIVGKCFALSLIMPSKCPINPANVMQEWIVQIIKHSDMY